MTTQIKMEQAMTLNRGMWARLAPSKIHGVGVFAIADLKKDQKLYLDRIPTTFSLRYADFNKLRPEVAQILIERWPAIVEGSAFIYPDSLMQPYMNHSDTPNYDGVYDLALKDIAAGEEVTEDYRLIPGWKVAHPWLVEKDGIMPPCNTDASSPHVESNTTATTQTPITAPPVNKRKKQSPRK